MHARWTRLGVLFGVRPARRTPDVEHLLLDTARCAPGDARLFSLAVSWVGRYGGFVARHRLKHLIRAELGRAAEPLLGALLAFAVEQGATRELLSVARVCRRADSPRPAFDVHDGGQPLRRIARTTASPVALEWNLWIPGQTPRLDALRPASWILEKNPELADRIVRRGDLRASILVTLRRDLPGGRVESEAALARLCSANRLAVRKALADLELEGYRLRRREAGRRRTEILLEA